ncbi:MAG: hypothetical protein SCALA702_17720 [Melioribacteraceae bacterium]|nr:MAG: hypothetical protein SCALA702_17720 [Melioribacteraceae bacterium]
MKYLKLRSIFGFNNETVLERADLSRVPFVATHAPNDNSGFTGLSARKMDVYICYSRMTDKQTVDTILEKISERVKVRGMENAVDLASAKINGRGVHDTVVTIGNVAIRGLDSTAILTALDTALDDMLYDAMYLAKRDFTKPHIS